MLTITKELYKKYNYVADCFFELFECKPDVSYRILHRELEEVKLCQESIHSAFCIYRFQINRARNTFRIKLYHMLLHKYIIYDIRCIIISYIL